MSSLINKMKEKLHVGKDKDRDTLSTASESSQLSQQQVAATQTGQVSQTSQRSAAAAGAPAAQNVAVAGQQQQAAQETVVVHEHDPHWAKARELTHGAEQASKISAAKAYEAESNLITAQDAHKQAQDAATRHAHLAAQAEAEKQNIGVADYLHKEIDAVKNKIEEREKIHVDLNKNLESSRNLVAAKEGELGSVAPVVQQHQKEIDALANKLGSLQGAKAQLEDKHNKHAAALNELHGQRGQYTNEVARLEGEVEQLNAHAAELEEQARVARAAANDKLKQLQAAKSAAANLAAEADRTAKGLAGVQKDLQGYQTKEAELAQRLNAAQAAAKDAADLAAAKEAELQLARQQLEAEQAKGLPVAQDIDRYRRELEEKERQYTEAAKTSEAARAAYQRFAAEAEQARAAAVAAQSVKDTKLEAYQQLKAEAQVAKEREAALWEEAKKHGNTGDVNALQRLAEAEKFLTETHGVVAQPVVIPEVGPKVPTTAGPTITRSEDITENTDRVAEENVRTHL